MHLSQIPIVFQAPTRGAAALCGEAAAALGRMLDGDRSGTAALLELARALRSLLAAPQIDDATLVVLARTFDATTLYQVRARAQAFAEALEGAGTLGRQSLLSELRDRCVRLRDAAGGAPFPCQVGGCAVAECRQRGLCTQLQADRGDAGAAAPRP